MVFRQLFEPVSSSYTYLLACPITKLAVLIDPVLGTSDRDFQIVKDLGLTLAFTLETHIHADHITGGRKLKLLTGSKLAGPKLEGLACVDHPVEEGIPLEVGSLRIHPLHTPGHTATHHSYWLDNGTQPMLFTGDALLIDGCGRTDFQVGDAATLYRSVIDKLFTLPDDTLVYPGHDYQGRCVSSIAQEKRRNPRLGAGKTLPEFVEIMSNLNLPKPLMMDFAIPGNQTCGQCPPNIPPELKGPCELEMPIQG